MLSIPEIITCYDIVHYIYNKTGKYAYKLGLLFVLEVQARILNNILLFLIKEDRIGLISCQQNRKVICWHVDVMFLKV